MEAAPDRPVIAGLRAFCPTGPDGMPGSLVVQLSASDGRTGWGEAAGPGMAEAGRAALPLLAETLFGAPATAPARLHRRLAGHPAALPGALAAIDMAAWDLAGRIAGVALHDLLGGAEEGEAPLACPLACLPGGPPEAAAAAGRAAAEAGFRHAVLAAGGPPEAEAARLHALCAAVPGLGVAVDGGGAWDTGTARRFLHLTAALDYTLCDPCAGAEAARGLRPHCPRPLLLAAATVAEAVAAAAAGVDGLALPLLRSGGITPLRTMRDAAVALGLRVAVEGAGGAGIAAAALAQIAASTPAARRAPASDFRARAALPGAALPPSKPGHVRPAAGPGLGIAPEAAALGPPFFALAFG